MLLRKYRLTLRQSVTSYLPPPTPLHSPCDSPPPTTHPSPFTLRISTYHLPPSPFTLQLSTQSRHCPVHRTTSELHRPKSTKQTRSGSGVQQWPPTDHYSPAGVSGGQSINFLQPDLSINELCSYESQFQHCNTQNVNDAIHSTSAATDDTIYIRYEDTITIVSLLVVPL